MSAYWGLVESEIVTVGFRKRLSDPQLVVALAKAGYQRTEMAVNARRRRLNLLRGHEKEPANFTPLVAWQRDYRKEDYAFKLAMLAARADGSESIPIIGVVKDHRPFAIKSVSMPETFVPSQSALMNG